MYRNVICIIVISLLFFAENISSRDKNHNTTNSNSTTKNPVPLYWPLFCGEQQTGEVIGTFNCYGQFGDGFKSCSHSSKAFETPSNSDVEYLFGGGIWVGGISGPFIQDTLVTIALDGWLAGNDFSPKNNKPSVTKFNYPTDFSMRAIFSDTNSIYSVPTNVLKVEIVNRSHAFYDTLENMTIIYDMIIKNVSHSDIYSGYVGFYFDADVGYSPTCSQYLCYTDDISGSIRDLGIGYVIDNDGDPGLSNLYDSKSATRVFAFKFHENSFNATDTNFNWWISNGNPSFDFGPRRKDTILFDYGTGGLGTPDGDMSKYSILSFPEWDYDQVFTADIDSNDPKWLYPNQQYAADFSNGWDTRILMSLGPFNLRPDSSIRVLYSTFTGYDVHVDELNYTNNLIDNYSPQEYLDSLNFLNLIEISNISDSLSNYLLDPTFPPIGLGKEFESEDSIVVRWDPWVFSDVLDYNVYLTKVNLLELPYPRVVPPWFRPNTHTFLKNTNLGTSETFVNVGTRDFYFVNVSHSTSTAEGELSDPIFIQLGAELQSPIVENLFVLLRPGEEALIEWTHPDNENIDHYNIYKAVDKDGLSIFEPFYDEGYAAQLSNPIIPKDTFDVDGITYYYYAPEDPIAVVTDSINSYIDYNFDDSTIYKITAVDDRGFESDFSNGIYVDRIPSISKDVLVLTSRLLLPNYVYSDTILSFYDSLLGNLPNFISYDFLDFDSLYKFEINPDWHEFMKYSMVIIDADFDENVLTPEYEGLTAGFTRYLEAGGKLAYFGNLSSYFSSGNPDTLGAKIENPFINDKLGIDSVRTSGWSFYYDSNILIDSIFALERGQTTDIIKFNDISVDNVNYKLASFFSSIWVDSTSPPSTAVFVPNEKGEVTHLYRSSYPSNSVYEGLPVGIRTQDHNSNSIAYTFGFHLWQMDISDARQLIVNIIDDTLSVGVDDNNNKILPNILELHQNYPNPFNPSTTISFTLNKTSNVKLEIYNTLGRRVRTLLNKTMKSGNHKIEWNGKDGKRKSVASGIYFYKITADEYVESRKMLLLK